MSKPEVDCTRKCKSRSHGLTITSAITKRSVSDESLASFILGTCLNFTQAFDFEGRTALHMSASRGRKNLMEWLFRHSSEAFANAKDRESGYTALHRSIFYGQIHSAVSLIKLGINIDIVDKDDFKGIEHAMLDKQYMYKQDNAEPLDVYVWGSNSNYTLATGTQQQRKAPELLNCFSRTNTSIKQVCLGKFHSTWLSSTGDVYACGQLARAGAPASTALRPINIKLPESCIATAITANSTLYLLSSGMILQYSLNSEKIVSECNAKTSNSVKLPTVKPIMKLGGNVDICASRVHVVVWNMHVVYTWGTNLGQLGHNTTEKRIDTPKKVPLIINNVEDVRLSLAAASDAATLVTTTRGDVYLLHKHICKKIAIRQINLKQVCVDAKVNEHGVYSRVTALLLTNVGQLYVWQDTTNALTRCVFGFTHQICITHITLTHDAVYFITKYGEAFVGSISRKTPPANQVPAKKDKDNKSLVKFLEKHDCTSVRITKIPNIHRAVSFAVDSEGLNFSCLQIKPICGLTSLPKLSPTCHSKHMDTLFETATRDDILHDVIFKVGTRSFPLHIFVIASGSEYLYNLYKEKKSQNNDDIPIVTLDNLNPDVFERILKYLYTGSCDVAEMGPCSLKIRKDDIPVIKKEEETFNDLIENPTEVSAFEVYKGQNEKSRKNNKNRKTKEVHVNTYMYCNPVKLVQAAAKKLQVMTLHKLLDKFYYREGIVYSRESALSRNSPLTWDRELFPELVDTNVRSKDGVLIPAHKCLLAARLEYFHGMFMHSWTESKMKSTVTLPINHNILLPVIDFLYSDTCPDLSNTESIDYICSLLIVADQLFILRLREMCEIALSNLITLKNCAELCQFAHTYNATQLKQCTIEFICLNLACVLENRSLDILDDGPLKDITDYYCQFNPIMSSRVITPFFNAPSDEIVEDFLNHPIDLDVTNDDFKRDEVVEVKKRKNKKIEYTENEKARMRYESVSSANSLDLSNDNGDVTLSLSKITVNETPKKEKWTEIPTSQKKHQKVIEARLKAITSAKDIMNEPLQETFTKLSKSTASSPVDSTYITSPKDSVQSLQTRSSAGNITISHVGPKLSQKQRKKLAFQEINLPDEMISPPKANVKNPWKIIDMPTTSSSPIKKTVEFNQILADQKKQKDDFSRIMTKPLQMTQLEDKAIEELERFYNVHEIDDELISVRRIELQVSSPQWIHTVPK